MASRKCRVGVPRGYVASVKRAVLTGGRGRARRGQLRLQLADELLPALAVEPGAVQPLARLRQLPAARTSYIYTQSKNITSLFYCILISTTAFRLRAKFVSHLLCLCYVDLKNAVLVTSSYLVFRILRIS